MRAAICEELGSVVVKDTAPAEPGPGQVLLTVEAAGVNYVDALFVQGRYQIKPPLPFVPGSEVAGTLPDGTRVLAMCGLGGFASHVAVPAAAAVPIPDKLDAPRAATFTQSYCTALFALRDRAALAAGETVLVLGAGGGVGLAAVQVATALGARVLAVASSEEKRRAALAAGADSAVDPTDVKAAARAWSDGGVDLVYDPVGGALADPALRALRERGRYVVIGFASGDIPSLPLNQVLLRNRSVVGVDWGAWSMTHPAEQRALLDELLAMVAEDRLDPVAPRTEPLASAPGVLDDLLNRRVVGKVALLP
ncbi:NADPH:quinone oxidoreductase family protein [Actinomadura montaniterrae]|jgi:NADPH2:quinone reductase|uniref:NADPH:quinone oxidoreductase family protein n=1 Tax=Actinomadura montaniterrae TaxID=1803903 RepID=A0A6L3VM67_9ACTN|nr:NADPH:quinone oxidoreductase family protein [Actinomadura montaniterrae]KAB2373626.1 NADPH:quinone oxidoreductase family protein [Actinomadura montaniterrae]